MKEQIIEKQPSFESAEDRAWVACEAAMDEENLLWKEIEDILKNTPDRKVAENIILENYAARMDEAMKKSGEAFRRWWTNVSAARELEKLSSKKKGA